MHAPGLLTGALIARLNEAFYLALQVSMQRGTVLLPDIGNSQQPCKLTQC